MRILKKKFLLQNLLNIQIRSDYHFTSNANSSKKAYNTRNEKRKYKFGNKCYVTAVSP